MKSATILCLCLFGLIAVCSAQTDYCATKLCGGYPHIGCGNTGALAAICPSSAVMVNMTDLLKNTILQSHNSKRNTIAGGGLPGFNPAIRMATMEWNDDLATLASYNVKTCTFAHDYCHNTDEFNYSGQNLAKLWWSGGSNSEQAIISGQIDSWWNEYMAATLSDIRSFPYTTRRIGHFTVMARDTNIAVGCAAIKFIENGWNTLTLACNYATNNMLYWPVYVTGNMGANCTTGMNPDYTALCSEAEEYDVNKFV